MIDFLAAHLDVALFGAAIILMMFGFPVAFTLAGVALGFAWLGAEVGVFRWAQLNFLPQRVWAAALMHTARPVMWRQKMSYICCMAWVFKPV